MKKQVSPLVLPPPLQARDLFNSLQLDLLRKLSVVPTRLNIALMNPLHRASAGGKSEALHRVFLAVTSKRCGPLPESLNGCLAFLFQSRKQSSWSGQHSKQQHFTEHIHISPALSPGELALCREDGKTGRRGRWKEIGMQM